MMYQIQDWAADCDVCGNIALARLRNPKPIAGVANMHEMNYPSHYVTVRTRGLT